MVPGVVDEEAIDLSNSANLILWNIHTISFITISISFVPLDMFSGQ